GAASVHMMVAEAPGGARAEDPGGGGGARPARERPGELAVAVLAGTGVWVVSGRSGAGLAAQAGRLGEWVAGRRGLEAGDVGWSLVRSRPALEPRAVVTGAGRGELAAGLAAVAAGEPAPNVVSGVVPAGGPGKTVFVFPGQGSQWA